MQLIWHSFIINIMGIFRCSGFLEILICVTNFSWISLPSSVQNCVGGDRISTVGITNTLHDAVEFLVVYTSIIVLFPPLFSIPYNCVSVFSAIFSTNKWWSPCIRHSTMPTRAFTLNYSRNRLAAPLLSITVKKLRSSTKSPGGNTDFIRYFLRAYWLSGTVL